VNVFLEDYRAASREHTRLVPAAMPRANGWKACSETKMLTYVFVKERKKNNSTVFTDSNLPRAEPSPYAA